MSRLPVRSQALGLLLLLQGACIGTNTGNPLGGDPGNGEETSGGRCEARSTREIAEDTPTELGFSARDVLTNALGERQETLRWQALRIADYGPESGEQALTVRIERAHKPIRFVDYEPKSGGSEEVGEIALSGVECPDAIEIDVDLTLRSAQGALNERLRTTLRAHSKEMARIFHRLDPEQLGGSFAVSAVHTEGFALTELQLSLSVTRFGISGELDPTFERRTADAISNAGSGPLALWGPATCQNGTPVPLSAQVKGFSAAEVLALLNERRSARASWHDGSETSVTFGFAKATEGACAVLEDSNYVLEGKAGTLLIPGALTAQSSDQRIDAVWHVIATARPAADGVLDVIAIELDSSAYREPGSLAEQYGIHGFDVSRYSSYGVRVTPTLSAAGAWSGELTVTGYIAPNCPTTPMVDANGGVSSPGCPGSTPEQVARATFAGGSAP